MNALGRLFDSIFMPLPELPSDEQWKFTVVTPLMQKLSKGGHGWQAEDDICDGHVGMSIIGARCFWAKQLGFIEFKRRRFRDGWWIRLTPMGWRYLRSLED